MLFLLFFVALLMTFIRLHLKYRMGMGSTVNGHYCCVVKLGVFVGGLGCCRSRRVVIGGGEAF